MAKRIALYDLTHPQLAGLLAEWGEPRFRADQVWGWLYRSGAGDLEAMTNLPPALRTRLAAETDLALLTPAADQASANGQTRKTLFRLRDGVTIEGVVMSYRARQTACISTQAGCGMGCLFCATGQGGLARNLTAGEIVAQVMHFSRQLRQDFLLGLPCMPGLPGPTGLGPTGQESGLAPVITNVVLMGMGEPLANYAATWQAIETLTDPRGYHLGARRITLSTVGWVPGIRRLLQEELEVNLAVSLHAADDELRNRLVPINRRYPLTELMAAVRQVVERSRRRVTFEYALISGVNDSTEQARRLARLLHGAGVGLCHVNLIPLNPTPGSEFQPSPREQVDAFRDELARAGIPTTVRMRRGTDIEAGCGQLRRRFA